MELSLSSWIQSATVPRGTKKRLLDPLGLQTQFAFWGLPELMSGNMAALCYSAHGTAEKPMVWNWGMLDFHPENKNAE